MPAHAVLLDPLSQVLADKYEHVLREFGLDEIANLLATNQGGFFQRREAGRRIELDIVPELEDLCRVQEQYELEAGTCAQHGTYIAAVAMIGAAM